MCRTDHIIDMRDQEYPESLKCQLGADARGLIDCGVVGGFIACAKAQAQNPG